jgi:deazaflavin-dependent oxidoreductase (nitroreductase family)
MDPATLTALGHNQTVDLTTTGRHSGQPRRIEVYLHSLDGRLVISGRPNPTRTRAWIYNVTADPSVTLHLKQGVRADLPGRARVVTDPAERLELLRGVARNWGITNIDPMQAHAPLIEISVEGFPA